MYTAVKPIPLMAQRLLWIAACGLGSRVLPGERERWRPPLPPELFTELCASVGSTVGGPIDAVAVYERPQRHRAGLTMLACSGRRAWLVRVRSDAADLALERRISELNGSRPANSFRVPAFAGAGEVSGWHWIAYEPISTRPHSPIRSAGTRLFAEVGELVERAIPRPPDVPAHWRGAHGDVTPWNLRRGTGRTWLIDWEDAGWAPPNADRVYFAAVVRATRPGRVRPLPATDGTREALTYWHRVVSRRLDADTDPALHRRLLRALRGA